MKSALSLLALLLMPLAAHAAKTGIAQSPLLNIAGSGVVKPNLMVLYDNSGSMGWNFIPDYVGDARCRASSTLEGAAPALCKIGHPPFAAPAFNKQYYNPDTYYKAPVKADGTFYDDMTASATSNWSNVPADGFNVNKNDLRDLPHTNIDLASKFPDKQWCNTDSAGVKTCKKNSTGYAYPDATYQTSEEIDSSPYYFKILVGEHCSDATLKNCIQTAIGATPPVTHPYPAWVRFCTDKTLTNCQGKYLQTFTYPRFSSPSSSKVSFGTLTIPLASKATVRDLSSVTVNGVVITAVSVNAAGGLNSLAKVSAFANAIAKSIIDQTGLASQYTACVQNPAIGSGVPACSSMGIVLKNDGVVGIVPINCSAGSTTKTIPTSCTLVYDNSRNGHVVVVDAPGTKIAAPPIAGAADNGVFVRVDIVPDVAYLRGDKRVDCAAASFCTYAEEMINFANWYAYYRTRNQMMKSAVGMAFNPIGDAYNVGLVSLSTAAAEGTIDTPPRPFAGADRISWYDALYGMSGGSATPTRQALHAVGKMYANQAPYNYAAGSEVVKYPCQQNYTFVTSDGYWNGTTALSDVENNDQVENVSRFCTKASGCTDNRVQSAAEGVSLADIALYWYNGGSNAGTASLRPSLEDTVAKQGLVAAGPGENTRLHMTTFTLGLGVDGLMNYEKNYRTSKAGDFIKVLNQVASGCPWNSNGPYVWPDPVTETPGVDQQSRVDDLWHAAVNGHGQYFSAAEPSDVVQSLTTALLNIESKRGAAAAAATSTPNISLQDNDIFSDTFTTVKWYGELTKRKIDTVTGEVVPTRLWNSSDTVGTKVGPTDTRVIKMLDVEGGTLKNFKFDEMTSKEQAWFSKKCSALFQCSVMDAAKQALADSGENMVNWLRGQQLYANDTIFRSYSVNAKVVGGVSTPVPIVLGDIASSKPAFMREPRMGYTFDDYPTFVTDNALRKATVFVGANDGMLHAFDAVDGTEMWAYAPRITMKKLHKQASTTYATNHQYTVDGSPELADVQIGGVWKSVLVSGLNGGGRGYFALDVTDPANPVALWELCADPAVCSGKALEPELGLTFGNPQFGKWSGKWVVFLTSGYNNVPDSEKGSGADKVSGGSGNGFLFIVDIATGKVLNKTATVATGAVAGDVETPSGLARISAVNSNPNVDPKITHIYGGDILGQMWRFDLAKTPGAVLVSMMGDAGPTQPITTRPEVTTCRASTTDSSGVVKNTIERVVVYGTGRLLDVPDLATTPVQSLYAIKDSDKNIFPWRTLMVEQTLMSIGSAGQYGITDNPVDLSTKNGWFVDLKLNSRERINLDPKVVSGSVTVVTNVPDASTSCSVGGSSKVYRLNVCTGSYLNNSSSETVKVGTGTDAITYFVAGETLSSTDAAVGFIMVRLPTGVIKMVTTTASGGSITSRGPSTVSQGTRKAGWRRVRN